MADQRRRRQHPFLVADPDQPRQRREAAGRLDLRLARRLQGVGNAKQSGGRRRRALRHDADAEGRRGQREDRRRDLEVRSERRRAIRRPLPAPWRHRAQGSRVRQLPEFSLRARPEDRPADCLVRQGGPHRSARGPGRARREAERQRQHAGRGLRGSADHGQLGARDHPGFARPYSRVRRELRRAALDLPHHSPARRVRLRHLVEGRLQAVGRRQRVGRRDRRRQERDGVRRHRIGVVRFLRRHAPRRQSIRRLRARARRAHRQTRLAFPGHQARRLGLRLPCLAESRNGDAQRAPGRRRRADHQVRLRLRPQPQDRRAAVPGRVPQGPAVRDRRRASVRAAAVPGQAAAIYAPGADRADAHDADAGGPRRRAGAVQEILDRLSRAAVLRGHDHLPRRRRGRRMGRRGVRSRDPRSSTSTRTRCRGSSS